MATRRRKGGPKRKPLADRFYPYVGGATRNGCRLWLRGSNGLYGACMIHTPRSKNRYKTAGAHRVAWMLAHGPIPKGKVVRHVCGNPLCVAVEHLYLDTWKWHRAFVRALLEEQQQGRRP
jgi:hypothetical protein